MPPPVKKKRGEISRFDSDIVGATSFLDTGLNFPPSGTFVDGVTVRIDKIGGSSRSNGDGVASEIVFEVSEAAGPTWVTIRRYAVDGTTVNEPLNRTWKSDGNLQFRIRRRNNGASGKRISAWLDGYKKVST